MSIRHLSDTDAGGENTRNGADSRAADSEKRIGEVDAYFIPSENIKNGGLYSTRKESPPPVYESPTEEMPEEEDPWALVIPKSSGPTWKEKTCQERLNTMMIVILKFVILLGLLYLFVCSLGFLGDAFQLLGGKAASAAFRESEVLSNPVANLMMGILATVLLQSSSTSTSIVVAMVAAEILPVWPAIFVVMGANIGTSVTNTIVSLGQCTEVDQFRRAFAGATVHDMFNWLTVIIVLPIEWLSGSIGSWKGCGILCQLTHAMTEDLELEPDESVDRDFLKVITKPFTSKIVQLDKKVLIELAKLLPNETEKAKNMTLIKRCHADVIIPHAVSVYDNTSDSFSCQIYNETVERQAECGFMFEGVTDTWSEAAIGGCLLVIALVLLMACLILIVKLLSSLLQGQLAVIIQKVLNSDFPHPFGWITGYLAILVGWGMTMLLQSSSIFTSAITPLVGAGILHIKRMYPLTLGSNIGTTFTAVLAALASSRDKLSITLQVALCHLFFNIIGIIIWYPFPAMRNVPIGLAKKLGNKTAKHRWFAFVYIVLMFFFLPGIVFGISLAGWKVSLGVILPIFLLFLAIIIICVLQQKRPKSLPKKMQTWEFLPLWCHSLKPYDNAMGKLASGFKACGTCSCCRSHKNKMVIEETDTKEMAPSLSGHVNPTFASQDDQYSPL